MLTKPCRNTGDVHGLSGRVLSDIYKASCLNSLTMNASFVSVWQWIQYQSSPVKFQGGALAGFVRHDLELLCFGPNSSCGCSYPASLDILKSPDKRRLSGSRASILQPLRKSLAVAIRSCMSSQCLVKNCITKDYLAAAGLQIV